VRSIEIDLESDRQREAMTYVTTAAIAENKTEPAIEHAETTPSVVLERHQWTVPSQPSR
jgi:hypothetical protein